MIIVKKHKDKVWNITYYIAKATKAGIEVTGKTRKMALINLKNEMGNKFK